MLEEFVRPVRGMKDLFGSEIEKYCYIVDKALSIGRRYGYGLIETPILENTEVFQRSIGDVTDVVSKEMYTFHDRGGESVTMRPEGTAGVMRAIVSEKMAVGPFVPLKLMYYGPMFRYDRPQKGRFRQFHQIGFEHLGERSPYTDVITIVLASDILKSLGIFDFKVFVNTLGDAESREGYVKAIVKYFTRHIDELSEESRVRLDRNPLRILDSKDAKDKEICQMAPKIIDYLSKSDQTYFETVCKMLTDVKIDFEIDNLLVRGLDYYTQTTFELKLVSGSFRQALGGGGRYDGLLELFGGPAVSGVGFALGVERLMMLLDDSKVGAALRKIAIVPVSDSEIEYAFKVYREVIEYEFAAEFVHASSSLKKRFQVASRLGCEIVIVIGENEIQQGNLSIVVLDSEDERERNKTMKKEMLHNFLKTLG